MNIRPLVLLSYSARAHSRVCWEWSLRPSWNSLGNPFRLKIHCLGGGKLWRVYGKMDSAYEAFSQPVVRLVAAWFSWQKVRAGAGKNKRGALSHRLDNGYLCRPVGVINASELT